MFVAKASDQIAGVSAPIVDAGEDRGRMITLLPGAPVQECKPAQHSLLGTCGLRRIRDAVLEGCQSVSPQYWQCDWHADLIWHTQTVGTDRNDYIYRAFMRGVVTSRCVGCALRPHVLVQGRCEYCLSGESRLISCRWSATDPAKSRTRSVR